MRPASAVLAAVCLVAVAAASAHAAPAATRTVVYGACVTLTGTSPGTLTVRRHGGPASAVPLPLGAPGTAWRHVDAPPLGSLYVVRSGSSSVTTRVHVRPRVTLVRASGGAAPVVEARVTGARSFAGAAVSVQRRVGTSWLLVRRLRLGADSTVRFRAFDPALPLRVLLPAREAGEGYVQGTSGAVVPAALAAARPGGTTAPPSDAAGALVALRAAGLALCRAGSVSGALLGVPGARYVSAGGDVHLYEFRDEAAAAAAAARVSPEGSSVRGEGEGAPDVHVNWVAAPHFYRSGRLVALYLGSDPATLRALEHVLGRQFAGR
jgi:hypothetical protein